jgi:hypothetical protein
MKQLPSYIRRLKQQVFDQTPSKPSEMPPAHTMVSIGKKTLNKDKLMRIASVISKANTVLQVNFDQNIGLEKNQIIGDIGCFTVQI